eukprot:CAMPEP_0172544366 /NCGR_PEP_ID=MMETSP1067-20121228/14542_1 /TAXON_ID=265564 ORGANISM="Thalassiosira punctigera, Strain Tpunct2005C2" /NCGR_SAMPLE_ID=MMETSP1067 /ASSEMBLY_ACC=CAM_ASM_000444 /LENGTH=118 /DNA_ID=CAMNT_0013330915 /DNA_START=55 /DNA_END=411 /DNA_ORIENTATION=-
MISAARLVSSRIARSNLAPRAVTAVGSTRQMNALGDKLASKEKVEEDRYIRAREAELAEAKAKAAGAEAKAKELEAKSAELVAKNNAAMNDVANMLATTGDVVSEAGLANLVDWKHSS